MACTIYASTACRKRPDRPSRNSIFDQVYFVIAVRDPLMTRALSWVPRR